MGASGSHPTADDARRPLIVEPRGGPAAGPGDDDEENICAVCLSSLERAATYTLPQCGHSFHALCLASALQVALLCPICQLDVDERVCREIASRLLAEPSHAGGTGLAAELLMEMRARDPSPESEVTDRMTIEALHRAARKGDASKVPSMAALLGRTKGDKTSQPQSQSVRLAAVEALRAVVPTFSQTWPALPQIIDLLRGVSALDGDEEVRCAALRVLREIGQRGDEGLLLATKCVLQDPGAGADLRLQAADTLQALAVRGDPDSMRTALLALGDSDCSVRSVGLTTLRQVCGRRGGCAEVLGDLAAMASSHREPEVRCAAMEIIGLAEEVGGAYGVAVATAGLQDADEEVPHAALATLRRLCARGNREVVAALAALSASHGREARLRGAALEVLPHVAQRGDPAAAAAAAAAVGDTDHVVRSAGLQTLRQVGERGDTQAVAMLLGCLDHGDFEVRRAAVEGLGHLASPRDRQAIAALRALASDRDDEMQMAASQALRRVQ